MAESHQPGSRSRGEQAGRSAAFRLCRAAAKMTLIDPRRLLMSRAHLEPRRDGLKLELGHLLESRLDAAEKMGDVVQVMEKIITIGVDHVALCQIIDSLVE